MPHSQVTFLTFHISFRAISYILWHSCIYIHCSVNRRINIPHWHSGITMNHYCDIQWCFVNLWFTSLCTWQPTCFTFTHHPLLLNSFTPGWKWYRYFHKSFPPDCWHLWTAFTARLQNHGISWPPLFLVGSVSVFDCTFCMHTSSLVVQFVNFNSNYVHSGMH